MLTINDAFRKFKSRLELNDKEQADASRRQNDIRDLLKSEFTVEHDFLTGSYKRWTKTKPLKDVDIFCVLGNAEEHYRTKPPTDLLNAIGKALASKYGADKVAVQRRSVCVDFGVIAKDDLTDYKIMSFDVVPAFATDDYYEIPDTQSSSGWTKTNPKIHEEKAIEAHQAYDREWKGLVRMMKYWNNHHGKPIKPSFLIEVMALEILHPPFGGDFAYEMQGFFHSLADRINETWNDPANLGPPVSDSMDASRREAARSALLDAGRATAHAIQLARSGKNGDSLKAWREIFGPLFPLS